MKLFAILVLIGFACMVSARSKAELEKRAKDLEWRLEAFLNDEEWGAQHLISILIMRDEYRRLKELTADLEESHTPIEINSIEIALSALEDVTRNELELFERGHRRPSTKQPPTQSLGTRPPRTQPPTTQRPTTVMSEEQKHVLEERARKLEDRLETQIRRLGNTEPLLVKLLIAEKMKLQIVSDELAEAKSPDHIKFVANKLIALEKNLEFALTQLENRTETTGTPGTRPTGTPGTRPTGTPGTRPTGTPGTRPTGTPGTRPTETPGPRPTGTPGSRPTGTPGSRPTGTPGPSHTGSPSTKSIRTTETPKA